jgi:hypothetical protein
MWYKVDYNKLAILLLPTILRKPKLIAYVQCLVFPISQLHYSWSRFREDNLYKVEHNAQVCKFRKALNDRFDQTQRRIYIGDGNRYERQYLYTTGENRPKYIGTMYLHQNEDYADTGVDFIVWVPIEIITGQYYELVALIEFYKLGGKRYKIESI